METKRILTDETGLEIVEQLKAIAEKPGGGGGLDEDGVKEVLKSNGLDLNSSIAIKASSAVSVDGQGGPVYLYSNQNIRINDTSLSQSAGDIILGNSNNSLYINSSEVLNDQGALKIGNSSQGKTTIAGSEVRLAADYSYSNNKGIYIGHTYSENSKAGAVRINSGSQWTSINTSNYYAPTLIGYAPSKNGFVQIGQGTSTPYALIGAGYQGRVQLGDTSLPTTSVKGQSITIGDTHQTAAINIIGSSSSAINIGDLDHSKQINVHSLGDIVIGDSSKQKSITMETDSTGSINIGTVENHANYVYIGPKNTPQGHGYINIESLSGAINLNNSSYNYGQGFLNIGNSASLNKGAYNTITEYYGTKKEYVGNGGLTIVADTSGDNGNISMQAVGSKAINLYRSKDSSGTTSRTGVSIDNNGVSIGGTNSSMPIKIEGSSLTLHSNYSTIELSTSNSIKLSGGQIQQTINDSSDNCIKIGKNLKGYKDTSNPLTVLGGNNVDSSTSLLIVGNGTSSSPSNAMRLTDDGYLYYNAGVGAGADYAEFFEWADGNPNKEDRIGIFVTFDFDKETGKATPGIKPAQPGDYILGVISGNPSFIGNGDEEWKQRWLYDDFDRPICETRQIPITKMQEVETGEYRTEIEYDENDNEIEVKVPITEIKEIPTGEYKTEIMQVQNPDYDPDKKYVSRLDRPEWETTGMLGVLAMKDDGTCQVGQYCKCGADGVATAAEKRDFDTYIVIGRVNDNVIKIVFR